MFNQVLASRRVLITDQRLNIHLKLHEYSALKEPVVSDAMTYSVIDPKRGKEIIGGIEVKMRLIAGMSCMVSTLLTAPLLMASPPWMGWKNYSRYKC